MRYWNPENQYDLVAPSGKIYRVSLWEAVIEDDDYLKDYPHGEHVFFKHCTFNIELLSEDIQNAAISRIETIDEISDRLTKYSG